ncbi:MAG TPA: hypothetical protein PK079_11715 [Leptospiraceae bacterium]|nr:hypothetical protein [Leptospiraceae bacterium]HMW07588.1 hypothetical protein [Leptospiraceae bacterium]HMX33034.1 hypothetical protein [Leptospiraceae bacterium]HMY33197.1 hypothetical protein [Leptospiraceae bacterium]HMZ66346.1 hypothetical protein [Leptospiraceae bacterium]
MNFGEGIQKISLVSEPLAYVRPIYTYAPIEQVNKIYSSDNYFNSSAFKEFKNGNKQPNAEKKTMDRGAILDLLA